MPMSSLVGAAALICPLHDMTRSGPVSLTGTEFLGLKIESADLSPEPGKPFPLTLQVRYDHSF